MFEHINIHSSVAVYMQIENHVQFAVSSGQLNAGEQLPSVRELSEKLDVNPNTVAKAYRDLEVMGIVYTRRGMGVYINKGCEKKCREQCRVRIVAKIFEVSAEAKASGMSRTELNEIAAKSFASDVGPYSPAPASVMALAKAKKPSK